MKHFLLVLLTVLSMSFTLLPAFEAQAGLIGQKQELEMGAAAARQIEAKYGVLQDPQIAERVERIGQSLAAVCGRKDLRYSFKVLNTEDINALALPGGHIYVFKGLLDYMPSDAELAGVLGHEIGHVVKRHTIHQIEKNMWTQLAAVLAGAATGNGDILAMGIVVSDALAAGYSRADETAADREGFAYTLKAGYSPYAMLVTLHKLQELAGQEGNPGWGLFDSHPAPEQRIKNIQKLLGSLSIVPVMTVKEDGTAVLEEKDDRGETLWQFVIGTAGGGNKPEYRAQLLAGALYQVRQKEQVDPTHFIVHDEGKRATIYYEDTQLLTVYLQDGAGFTDAGTYANYCAGLFRDWAELVNSAGNQTK